MHRGLPGHAVPPPDATSRAVSCTSIVLAHCSSSAHGAWELLAIRIAPYSWGAPTPTVLPAGATVRNVPLKYDMP